MKKLFICFKWALLFGFTLLIVSSCKKNNDASVPPAETYPTAVSSIVPQSMIDSVRNAGAIINAGITPSIVNGIYFMHPDSCTFDNSPGNFAGTIFADYKFRFSGQDNTAFTTAVEQKNTSNGALSPAPLSTYISGAGNKFSIFILRTSSPSGVPVQQFNILSGTLTANGVQDFQNILYIRSKNDPGNTLPPAGTIRVFKTGTPGLAVSSTTF